MNRGGRISLGVFAAALVLLAGAVTGLAWNFHRAGVVRVDIREYGRDGNSLSLQFPGAFLEAALNVLPAELCFDAGESREIHHRLPIARAFCRGLDRVPDCVLVEVESDEERVRVAKRGGSMLVSVDTPDERVRVEVPIHLMERTLEKIEKATRDHGPRRRHRDERLSIFAL